MIVLPKLINKTIARPYRNNFEENYLIPEMESGSLFWDKIYNLIRSYSFRSPVLRDIEKYIDPLSGYFGMRVHPVTLEAQYFHTGISLSLKSGRKIYPIAPGILEYSGYGAVNGYYILISHPEITTEDGYTLCSMYCHLKKPLIKFNSYQKMLREISLGSYPLISVEAKTHLGVASISGLANENNPNLYLQLSFRKYGEKPIVIDPMLAYYSQSKKNTTADITDPETIKNIFKKKAHA